VCSNGKALGPSKKKKNGMHLYVERTETKV
jgi:hypothetical protein